MAFEVFEKIPARTRGRGTQPPAVRIDRKKHTVSMNTTALALLPKSCTKVLIAFDKETRQLALVSTFDLDPKGVVATHMAVEGGGEKMRRPRAVSVGQLADMLDLPNGKFAVEAGKIGDRTAIITVNLPTPEPEAQP